MDLRLFAGVLRRFKKIVFGGFVLAVLLAVVSYGTPTLAHGKPTIKPRGREVWSSQALVILTQATFPYGRAMEQYPSGPNHPEAPTTPVGDTTLPNLAPIYVRLANGEAVLTRIHTLARVPGTVWASGVYDSVTNNALPFITLSSAAPTAADAALLATTAATVFQSVVSAQQAAAQIPAGQRVQLQLVDSGKRPRLLNSPKKTVPLLLFVTVFGASILLAFMLENANPKVKVQVDTDLRHGAHPAARALTPSGSNGQVAPASTIPHDVGPRPARRLFIFGARGVAEAASDTDPPAEPGRSFGGS